MISALSSRNIHKYEFLAEKYVVGEKYLLEKTTAMKRFYYSPLEKELKAQTDIGRKQNQNLDDTYEFDKT